MRPKVPSSFSKKDFLCLSNTLNTSEFQQYKKLFTDNYTCPRGGDTYNLKTGLSDEKLAELDYVLKRIADPKEMDSLEEIATYFRRLLGDKKYILLFAYNGVGKTRLCGTFKSLGQEIDVETGDKRSDTLYYSAFTEDLFSWDNDLDNDERRFLTLNSNSRFFSGIKELVIESKIRGMLCRYADFGFTIDYDEWRISFSQSVTIAGKNDTVDDIKISRGEESIFIWCFFLAIVQLVVEGSDSYSWVKYIYVDDPISSLDDNNAIAVAVDLAKLVKGSSDVKVIVSSHHALFFNVLCNEIGNAEQLFLQRSASGSGYMLRDTQKTPFFHHIALLEELKAVADSGELYTYHFNILRNILEKTASFHGYRHFSACIRTGEDEDSPVHTRMLNLLSHGNYSLFDPKEMAEEEKEHFKSILGNFIEDYRFNPKVFNDASRREQSQ